ncbi:MAG: hypothetical protein IT370_03030 [Deltaproteobacteria bacterium]|nr:hypothetical protein [Deltaproteobacteria bacterium]
MAECEWVGGAGPRGAMLALLLGMAASCSFNADGIGPVRFDGGPDTGIITDGGADATDGPPGVTFPVEVEIQAETDGVVRSTPAGLDCMTRCTHAFAANEAVTLTATASGGRQFLGWGTDCTGNVPCTLTVSGPRKVTARFGRSGTHLWSVAGGGAGAADTGMDVEVDARGDVFVAGQVFGTGDFGAGPTSDRGSGDAFVAKFSAAGELLWLRRFGGVGNDVAEALALAPGGDIYVVGQVQYDVDFGAGVRTGDFLSDGFIARYSGATGALVWVTRLGASLTAVAYDVAATSTGAVVAGTFAGTASFDGQMATAQLGFDPYLATVSSSGAVTALRAMPGSGGTDLALGIAVDGADNVVVVGSFEGSIDLGGGMLTTAGAYDMFIARYLASGAHDWSSRYGGPGGDMASAVAMDGAEPVVVGQIGSGIGVGGMALPSNGGFDMFVARYSSAGAHQWSRSFGGSGAEDELSSVQVGTGGTILATGRFIGNVDFGTGNINAGAQPDVVALGFTAAGARLWVRSFGGNMSDAGRGIAPLGDSFVLTGTKTGMVDFGGGNLIDMQRNVFVARLKP